MEPRLSTLLKVTLTCFIYILQINGFFPYFFHKSDRILYHSNICILYSMIYLPAYAYFIGRSNLATLANLISFKYDHNALLLGASVFSAYFQVFAMSFEVWIKREEFRLLFNQLLRLWSDLRKNDVSTSFDRKLLLKFCYKLFAVDGVTIFLVAVYYSARDDYKLVETISRVSPFMTSSAMSNFFISIGYLGAHYHRLVNDRIGRINCKVAKIDQNSYFWRLQPEKKRQTIEKLSGEFRQIVNLHGKINRLIMRFMELHSATLVIMAAKNFILIITGLFGIYGSTLALISRNMRPQLGSCAFYSILTVFAAVEFYFWVGSAAIFTKRVRQNTF